jgi:K+-sensing histidine kinase KdpD
VVGNLVDNAGKHAPPGTPIGVLVSQPDGLTRTEVADQGDGVPPIDRERVCACAGNPPAGRAVQKV